MNGARLGRGIASLLGEIASEREGGLLAISPSRLTPNPNQPRSTANMGSLDELADSIRVQGVLQPLVVREVGGDYEIVAGERRWRAATMAGLDTVPCIVRALTDHQAAALALVENLQRVDLNGLEEALGYSRLVTTFGLNQEAVADIVGKSRSHVANTLRLLKLPDMVREMLSEGRITAGHARALLTHPDPEVVARHVVAHDLSVRQTEALLPGFAERPTAAEKMHRDPVDPDIMAVERSLADQLGMRVRLSTRKGRGSLTVSFTTLDQLDLLIERLSRAQSPLERPATRGS